MGCLGLALCAGFVACVEAPSDSRPPVDTDGSLLFPLPEDTDAGATRSGALPAGACAWPGTGDAGPGMPIEDPVPPGPAGAPGSGNDAGNPVDSPVTPGPDAGDGVRPDAGESPAAGPTTAGQVIFSEVMPDPVAVADAEGEWLELHNVSEQTLDLAECILTDGNGTERAISAGLVLSPGQYRTVARSPMAGFVPDHLLSMTLRNSADQLALACGGQTIDEIAYDAAADYPLEAGASLALDPDRLNYTDNDRAESFCAATTPYGAGDLGTPGEPNHPCPSDN